MNRFTILLLVVLYQPLVGIGQPLPKLPMDEPGWDDEGPVGGLSGGGVAAEEEAPAAATTIIPPAQIPTDETQEALDKSFKKLAKLRHNEALRHFESKDYPKALAALRAAYDLHKQDPEIVNDLAYLLHTLGNRDDAVRFYREALVLAPGRYTANINLADLLMEGTESDENQAEAATLLMRARELSGNKPSVILRQARVAARRGRLEEALLFYKEIEMRTDLTAARLLEIGDFYRDFGRRELAEGYYKRIAPDGPHGPAAGRRLEQLNVTRTARRYGWASSLRPVPVAAQALLARARLFLGQDRLSEARSLLEDSLSQAPHYGEARMWLGDAKRRQGDLPGAELAYLRALALDSSRAEVHLRLGELYLADDERNRSAEAVLFLHNALQLRPEWYQVRLRLARACQAAGDLAEARHYIDHYLEEAEAEDPERAEAVLLAAALQGVSVRRGDQSSQTGAAVESLGAEVVQVLNRARSYLELNRPDAAMAELLSLPQSQRHYAVLNLEGRILAATDRLTQAIARFDESLTQQPEQAVTHEQLGLLHEKLGDQTAASDHYLRAQKLGSDLAGLHLVRLQLTADRTLPERLEEFLRPDRLWQMRSELRGAIAADPEGLFAKEAQSLLEQVESRLLALALAYSLAILLLVGGFVLWWRHRFGGKDLGMLVRLHPEAGPEVQRVLAAIRHEVLKHNTMVLSGLVQTLEAGGDASSQAQHLRETLFGNTRDDAVLGHLLNYCDQLRQIGRAHGFHLNLRHRDAAMKAILEGFSILEKAAGELERVEFMKPARKKRLVKSLKEAAQRLNVEGYEAVRTLLDRLRLLRVDGHMLEKIHQRICKEPKLAGLGLQGPTVDVDSPGPVAILVPRNAFEDVLGNLIRNAIVSTFDAGLESHRIGLGITTEVDPITGFETALFSVRDRSPQPLTTEMIRGRYIEGGLGLSSDLVARHEGSIDVEEGPGNWAKSVIVRFPLAPGEGELE